MPTSTLTNLLAEIAEDPDRMTEWLDDPEAYMTRVGLTEHEKQALRSGHGGAIRGRVINSVVDSDRNELMTEILFKAWSDPDFRQQLRTDPRAVLERLFTRRLPGIEFQVHEETPTVRHIVIPWLPPEIEEEIRSDPRKLRALAEAGGPRNLLRTGDQRFLNIEAQGAPGSTEWFEEPVTEVLEVNTVDSIVIDVTDIVIVEAVFADEPTTGA